MRATAFIASVASAILIVSATALLAAAPAPGSPPASTSLQPPAVGNGVVPAAWTRIVESRRPVDDDTIELNIKEKSVTEIIPLIAESTGKTVLTRMTQVQPTKITVLSTAPVSRNDALDRIYEALASNLIAVVEDEQVVWLDLLSEIPKSPRPPLFVGPDEDVSMVPCNGLVAMTVLPLRHARVQAVADAARSFAPAHCVLVFDIDSNQLVSTGTVAAAKQAQRVARSLDRPPFAAPGAAPVALPGGAAAAPAMESSAIAASVGGADGYRRFTASEIDALSRSKLQERLMVVTKLRQQPALPAATHESAAPEFNDLLVALKARTPR